MRLLMAACFAAWAAAASAASPNLIVRLQQSAEVKPTDPQNVTQQLITPKRTALLRVSGQAFTTPVGFGGCALEVDFTDEHGNPASVTNFTGASATFVALAQTPITLTRSCGVVADVTATT